MKEPLHLLIVGFLLNLLQVPVVTSHNALRCATHQFFHALRCPLRHCVWVASGDRFALTRLVVVLCKELDRLALIERSGVVVDNHALVVPVHLLFGNRRCRACFVKQRNLRGLVFLDQRRLLGGRHLTPSFVHRRDG